MRQQSEIINRIGEQQFLLRFFNENIGKQRAVILHSPTGIGKSFLVEHVMAQVEGRFDYVAMGQSTKYDGVTYIQQLAGALNDSAEETGSLPTFSQFRNVLRTEDIDQALRLIEDTVKPLGETVVGKPTLNTVTNFAKGLRGIISYFVSEDIPISEILRSSSSDAMALCERYTRYVLSRHCVVLRINRYDQIDAQSDFYLRSIYANSERLLLVLEITCKEQNESEIELRIDINDRFRSSVEYRRLKTVALKDITERYETYFSARGFEQTKFIEQAFVSASGNFRQFELLIRDQISKPLYNKLISSEEHILTLTREMPRNCKRLLALTCALPARLDICTIEAIWEQNSWSSDGHLSAAINKLQSDYDALICLEDGAVGVVDDVVKAYLLSSHELRIYHIEARNALLSALRRENLDLPSPDRRYINIISIISLIIQGQGSGDSSLLFSSLKELDLLRYPSSKTELAKALKGLFYEYVYKCREAATNASLTGVYDRTYEEICKILYRIGDIDLLDKISNSYFRFLPLERHNNLLRLTIISAKILAGRKDAITLIEAIDRRDNYLYIGSRLLLISYYRTFDLTRKAKHEWLELKNWENIIGSVFEGLLYEYGALASPLNLFKRIVLLKKARRYYQARKNQYHVASCSLGISSTYLYLPIFAAWRSRLAQKELNSISEILPQVRIMDHVIENQAAMIEMHRGNWNESTLERLKYAYNRCALAPDKLLIGANLINCFIELRRKGVETDSINVYVDDILAINRVYQNKGSEFGRYALSSCYRYVDFMDDRPLRRTLKNEDLSNMTIQLSIFNLGRPNTAISRLFVKYIYSRAYVLFWPRILPVYNWSIDFYSFQESS
jgi:hypothetical protein